jgi:hypothetical protein
VFACLMVAGVGYAIWKIRGMRRIDADKGLIAHNEAVRNG